MELNEQKNIGILYHFTTVKNFIYMVNDGYMETSTDDLHNNFISFSRNKNLIWNYARLVFDGNKMSNTISLKPIHYHNSTFGGLDKRNIPEPKGQSNYNNQYEERAFLNTNRFDFLKYLIKVDLLFAKQNEMEIQNFIKILNSKNINYEIKDDKNNFYSPKNRYVNENLSLMKIFDKILKENK